MDPAEHKRLDRDESYRDPAVKNDFHADVWLVDDRNASGVWRVEYQDDDGGCYVTIFAGPAASQRARDILQGAAGGTARHDPGRRLDAMSGRHMALTMRPTDLDRSPATADLADWMVLERDHHR